MDVFDGLIFMPIIPIAKNLVKAGCCCFLKSWGYVAVSIESYLNTGMT